MGGSCFARLGFIVRSASPAGYCPMLMELRLEVAFSNGAQSAPPRSLVGP